MLPQPLCRRRQRLFHSLVRTGGALLDDLPPLATVTLEKVEEPGGVGRGAATRCSGGCSRCAWRIKEEREGGYGGVSAHGFVAVCRVVSVSQVADAQHGAISGRRHPTFPHPAARPTESDHEQHLRISATAGVIASCGDILLQWKEGRQNGKP